MNSLGKGCLLKGARIYRAVNSVERMAYYNRFTLSCGKRGMSKNRLGKDQEEPMQSVTMRMELDLERWARKQGGGNVSAHVRKLLRADKQGFVERRHGTEDRRRRK